MTARAWRGALATCAAALAFAAPSSAQDWGRPAWVGTLADEDARLAELAGVVRTCSRLIRDVACTVPDTGDVPVAFRARLGGAAQGAAPWRLLAPSLRTVHNSDFPFTTAQGPLWSGRGLSTQLELGAEGRIGRVSWRVAPSVTWTQNRDFAFPQPNVFLAEQVDASAPGLLQPPAQPGYSPFAQRYEAAQVDLPWRFGDAARVDWWPGASHVQLEGLGLAIAASTAPLQWGPGYDNTLLFSANAPGFRHVSLATPRPFTTPLGAVEFESLVGWLDDSPFWIADGASRPPRRLVRGAALVLSPRGVAGLDVGLARLVLDHGRDGRAGPWNALEVLAPFVNGHRVQGQAPPRLTAAWVRWSFPDDHTEAYAELGRNARAENARDAITYADWSWATVFGVQHLRPTRGAHWLRLRGEIANTEVSADFALRDAPTWYYGGTVVPGGFTQRGRVLGGQVGPGGTMATLVADWIAPRWTVGAFLDWRRFNTDDLYRRIPGDTDYSRSVGDVAGSGGVQLRWIGDHVDLQGVIWRTRRINPWYRPLTDASNTRIEMRATWRP